MCMPVVIDNVDLSGVDPNDPTLRDKATGTDAPAATIPKATDTTAATAPAGGDATPAAPAINDGPAPREDLWINAGDWLRGGGTYAPSTAVGSPTGGVAPAAAADPAGVAPTSDVMQPPAAPTGGATDPAVTAAQGPNADLMNAISAQASGFSDVAKGIVASQQAAADALKSGFLDLTKQQQDALKAADELRRNTGQAARAPNYSLSMQRNASRARAGGIASTMLSGVGGVPVSSLSLGRASLLGGGAG